SAANRSAIARPIPRDAPVTRAALPSNRCGTCLSYQRRGRVEIGECPETGRLHVGQGTPHQARQHLPRADLEKTIAAELGQALQGLDPAHGRVDLHLELLAEGSWIAR